MRLNFVSETSIAMQKNDTDSKKTLIKVNMFYFALKNHVFPHIVIIFVKKLIFLCFGMYKNGDV